MAESASSTGKEPWLSIPLADYEGHMEAVGQTAAFRRRESWPASLASIS